MFIAYAELGISDIHLEPTWLKEVCRSRSSSVALVFRATPWCGNGCVMVP